MQTGYDNYWMYQNNRHEPVHNLPKNDNYSHPVLTNNYKQMQNGRYPSNTYFTPSNNVARSQNGPYSTDPRCMWPSSMYLLPYNSSYVNNYHSQIFSSQTSNCSYSSQPSQPKPALRNSNINELQNKNYNQSNVTTRLPPISNYTDTDIARIRVKDVFTLNNNSIYSSVLEKNLIRTQKNKQYEYPSNNCNRTCDFETNEPALKQIPSSYVQREQPCLNDQQQFLQYSDIPYEQSAHLSAESQIQSSGNRQMGSNLQSVGYNARSSMLLHMLRNKNLKEVHSNTLEGNKRVTEKAKETNHFSGLKGINTHISTERTNSTDYSNLSQVNESYTSGFNVVQNQNQGNFQNIDQTSSLSQISSVEGSRIVASNKSSFSDQQINSIESNVVKITIPHTGQSTYIQFNELGSGSRNSSLNLPSLLETNSDVYRDALSKNSPQNYIPLPESGQVRRQSCDTSGQPYNVSSLSNPNDCPNSTTRNRNYTYYNNKIISPGIGHSATTPDRRFQQESINTHPEAFLGSKDCSENTPENFGVNIPSGKENEVSQTGSISHVAIVAVKQERLGVDDSNTQLQNITIDEEIKTEKYSEDYEIEKESHSSENPGLPSEDINSDKKKERSVSKKIVPGCKNAVPKLNIPKKTPNEDTTKKNSTEQDVNLEKKYVSKINRDKLDLLIQFLKKEDEDKTKTSADSVKETGGDIKSKKEINSTRSRRKLSKTDIVKNKNNSREMVSLMSHKTSRAEAQDPSKRPQTSKTDGIPKKEEEKKICSDEVNKNEKYVDISDYDKSYNPSQESKEQKNSDSKPEPEMRNVSVSSQTKESPIDEEKNIVSIMQALQNLKSHFCLSCTLVSPIDSFWINVISGELRCLNCFKKMNMKIDENILKLKRASSDDCNKTEPKPPPQDKTQKGDENKKDDLENKSKCECEKSNESTKVNENRCCTSKHKNTEMKDATSRKKRVGETEEKSGVSKDDINFKTEDSSKVEMKTKRKLSVKDEFVPDKVQNSEENTSSKIRKKSNSEESYVAVNTSKQWSDSPGKKNTKEEKTKVHFDNLKTEKKPSSQSAEKCISKEPSIKTSRENLEQEIRDSENSVKQLKEEDVSEAGKTDKRQSSQSRKRASSKEKVGHHKVRISEEEGTSAVKSPSRECLDSCKVHPTNEPTDKSKTFSSETCIDQKAKISSKHLKTEDSEKKNTSVYKNVEKSTENLPKKRKKSVEDLVPLKIFIAEDRTKYPKQSFEKSKSTKADDIGLKHKTPEHSKHHASDSETPRRKSKDEGLASTTEFDKTRRNSTSKENLNSSLPKKEIKYKRMILENYERDKKSFLGKIPKIPRKTTESVGTETNKSAQNDDKYQKSKPLKESQRTEDETNELLKKKELHENKHRHKEPQKSAEKKKNDTNIEDNFEKKAQKGDKSRTVKQTKKDKALECIFGKKKEDLVLKEYRKMSPEKPPSAKLLEKLFEKTKKLSWTLLGES